MRQALPFLRLSHLYLHFQERQQHFGFSSFPAEVYQHWSKRLKVLIPSILRLIPKAWGNLYTYSTDNFCYLLGCNLQIFIVLICFGMKIWEELVKVQSIMPSPSCLTSYPAVRETKTRVYQGRGEDNSS